jgi:hypothetical protein
LEELSPSCKMQVRILDKISDDNLFQSPISSCRPVYCDSFPNLL